MNIAPKYFKTKNRQKLRLPVFFPDATRAVLKTLDSIDIANTKTPGILVNTYHLYKDLGKKVIKKHQGVGNFMNWQGAIISDSGGFQVMSLAKRSPGTGTVTDKGVVFKFNKNKKILLTPEKSIEFQMLLKPDMVVVLDDFTPANASQKTAWETVNRTILWAKRSKKTFEKICRQKNLSKNNKPYLLAVVQGGEHLEIREQCTKRLVEIGFDGLGYGGWPIDKNGQFIYSTAKVIAQNTPKNYLLYGLGIGKPDEIVNCFDLGFKIFDCVLPTRDARHRRLYIFQAKSIKDINVRKETFYSYFTPGKEKYYQDLKPVSQACDCLLCQSYTRSYFSHLWKIKDYSAMRLATIHNLRFYSILMEKLQNETK